MSELEARKSLLVAACTMQPLGINQGMSGNLSCRSGSAMLITPSAIAYDAMTPEMIARMSLIGDYGSWEGPKRPSSEWRFHLDIMRERPDVGAIVHTHAPYATALAMARREIPACHYMIARFGGAPIRVADYALFGTPELSANALLALQNRTACLLANHGLIATGANIQAAIDMAVELETLAKQYVYSLAAGGPVLLSPDEIAAAIGQFATAYTTN